MLYQNTFASNLTAAIKQIKIRVSFYFQTWSPEELYFTLAQYNSACVVHEKVIFRTRSMHDLIVFSSSDKWFSK